MYQLLTWWFGPVVTVDYADCGSIPYISYAKLESGQFFQWPLVFGSASVFGEELHTFLATRSENFDIMSTSPSYSAGDTLLCAMPGSIVNTCYASAPGCFWTVCAKGNLDLFCSPGGLRFTKSGEECTDDASVCPSWLHLKTRTFRPRALRIWHFFVRCPLVA